MKSLTRRTFLTTSGMGTGLGLLAAAGVSKDALAQTDPGSSITSNFNGTPIAAGDFIWFNSVLKVQGLGSDPVTIGFTGSISVHRRMAHRTWFPCRLPSSTFSPSVIVATTVFCNGQWVTTVPLSGLSGNVFLDGVAVQAPTPGGFPGGIKRCHVAGDVLQPHARPQDSMAMGGGRLPQCEFRRRLQCPWRETGGRQQRERLSQFGPCRHARKLPTICRRWCERRWRIEFHRLLQRHRRDPSRRRPTWRRSAEGARRQA